MTSQRDSSLTLRLLIALVITTAIGPFSMQVFVPALPAIQHHFSVNAAIAQLVFSASAFAMAIATLAYGPISDRVGRRATLLAGLCVFAVGSLMCFLAHSIEALIAGRIIQASGGVVGMVLGRAIIRDLCDDQEAARAIAYVTMAMVAAPMIAPVLGSLILESSDWHYVFAATLSAGILVLIWTWIDIPETASASDRSQNAASGLWMNFQTLLKIPAFVAYSMVAAFSMCVFFSFLGGAPYVIITVMDLKPQVYAIGFMTVSGSFMLGNLTAATLTRHVGINRLIITGSAGTFAGCLILAAGYLFYSTSVYSLFAPVMIIGFFQGIALPGTQAAIVSVLPKIAGAASGLSGFLQLSLSALAAQIVGTMQFGSALPMILSMSFCAAAMLTSAVFALRYTRRSA